MNSNVINKQETQNIVRNILLPEWSEGMDVVSRHEINLPENTVHTLPYMNVSNLTNYALYFYDTKHFNDDSVAFLMVPSWGEKSVKIPYTANLEIGVRAEYIPPVDSKYKPPSDSQNRRVIISFTAVSEGYNYFYGVSQWTNINPNYISNMQMPDGLPTARQIENLTGENIIANNYLKNLKEDDSPGIAFSFTTRVQSATYDVVSMVERMLNDNNPLTVGPYKIKYFSNLKFEWLGSAGDGTSYNVIYNSLQNQRMTAQQPFTGAETTISEHYNPFTFTGKLSADTRYALEQNIIDVATSPDTGLPIVTGVKQQYIYRNDAPYTQGSILIYTPDVNECLGRISGIAHFVQPDDLINPIEPPQPVTSGYLYTSDVEKVITADTGNTGVVVEFTPTDEGGA